MELGKLFAKKKNGNKILLKMDFWKLMKKRKMKNLGDLKLSKNRYFQKKNVPIGIQKNHLQAESMQRWAQRGMMLGRDMGSTIRNWFFIFSPPTMSQLLLLNQKAFWSRDDSTADWDPSQVPYSWMTCLDDQLLWLIWLSHIGDNYILCYRANEITVIAEFHNVGNEQAEFEDHEHDVISIARPYEQARQEGQGNWWYSSHWKQYSCLACTKSHLLIPQTSVHQLMELKLPLSWHHRHQQHHSPSCCWFWSC